MYSYYQIICKQLSECVNKKNQCGKRVFLRWPQWLAVREGGSGGSNEFMYF